VLAVVRIAVKAIPVAGSAVLLADKVVLVDGKVVSKADRVVPAHVGAIHLIHVQNSPSRNSLTSKQPKTK
jgi:hypothetical protein